MGFDHFKVALSIGVMKMVRADLGAAGVIFTLDTESGFRDVVFITGAWGIGENVVQGAVDPDEFYVFKPTFKQGHRAVLRRALGSKKMKMVYAQGGTRHATRNIPTPVADRERFCISDADVLTLADYAIKVEEHYSARAGEPRPMPPRAGALCRTITASNWWARRAGGAHSTPLCARPSMRRGRRRFARDQVLRAGYARKMHGLRGGLQPSNGFSCGAAAKLEGGYERHRSAARWAGEPGHGIHERRA